MWSNFSSLPRIVRRGRVEPGVIQKYKKNKYGKFLEESLMHVVLFQGFKSTVYPYVLFHLFFSMERLHKYVKHYAGFNKFCVSEVTFLCWKKPSNNGKHPSLK